MDIILFYIGLSDLILVLYTIVPANLGTKYIAYVQLPNNLTGTICNTYKTVYKRGVLIIILPYDS